MRVFSAKELNQYRNEVQKKLKDTVDEINRLEELAQRKTKNGTQARPIPLKLIMLKQLYENQINWIVQGINPTMAIEGWEAGDGMGEEDETASE